MNKPRGILFDYGSTLFTQVAFNKEAGAARLLEIADSPGGASLAEVLAVRAELDAYIWPRCEETTFEFPLQAYLRLLFEQLGITFGRPLSEVELEFWKASMHLAPEPDLLRALDALRDEGLPLGIVSNSAFSGEALGWELERHGLRDRFRFVVSSADYGIRKPHPALLRVAAVKLGVKPKGIWFVGDMLKYDVGGALDANMTAVWYNPGKAPCDGRPPHLEVAGWAPFIEAVRSAR